MHPPVHYHLGEFPPKHLDWSRLIPLLGPAAAAVARYDGLLAAVPNAQLLVAPLVRQEAELSSRIEGTQATAEDVLLFEARKARPATAGDPKTEDIQEILNYHRALWRAEELLSELPLSLRVVREAHQVLMAGVRGQSRDPGAFRRNQNWIGPPGSSVEDATYIPIAAHELEAALGRWERYLHDEDQPDRLVQLAISHAEFEALHPFLDGNGRIGRILIPLTLWRYQLIGLPVFYMSAFLEARRDEYYERLRAISRDGDWTGWCAFFLEGVRVQAEANTKQASAILALYEQTKSLVLKQINSQYTIFALDWIFERPIFSSSDFVKNAAIPSPSARRLLGELLGIGILEVAIPGAGRRPAIHAFPELLTVVGMR